MAELLLSKGLVPDAAQAQRLAEHSEGSIQRAVELADPDLWAFRSTLYEHLCAGVGQRALRPRHLGLRR